MNEDIDSLENGNRIDSKDLHLNEVNKLNN